jgi:hypothetical protein
VNWKRFEKMLQPQYAQEIVKKHMRRATLFNGKIYEKQIRDTIKNGQYTQNAALTIAIKGENKPLVGYETGATLFKAITSVEISGDSVFVGVLRTDSFYNIAKTIHDGKTIKVTKKMRGLFLALHAVSVGSMSKNKLSNRGQELFSRMQIGWKPLKKSTQSIIIPAREFIIQAMRNSAIKKLAKENWQAALKKAVEEISVTK